MSATLKHNWLTSQKMQHVACWCLAKKWQNPNLARQILQLAAQQATSDKFQS
jgi:hypothetical protein